ncbi:hypothetical protein [Haladaptatus caseinilyticus]|uniref:hypothetical protein n=1 Tax=Haladaptatus caseinilyticus TaxID=2993314 RepID=UPI00224B4AFF|nr:hypothetical protein [Haladaptatus caseinilyticus]
MDLFHWLTESRNNIEKDGIGGIRESLWPVYRKFLEQGRRFQPAGDNIYDYSWDLLIVVDSCRYDLMCEVANQYDYIPKVDSHWSVDSTTAYWMRRTFKHDQIKETTYICSNPFSDNLVDNNKFKKVVELWKCVWEEPGTVPPQAVTDETIRAMRGTNSDRTIAHYLQPHCPFIPKPFSQKKLNEFSSHDHRDVWELYRDRDITLDELWEGYRKNLELVLDNIHTLLESVNGDVVITSDHGNALGKWGIYGHPPRMPHSSLRTVPWIETEATNTNGYEPDSWIKEHDMEKQDQLKALGYLD